MSYTNITVDSLGEAYLALLADRGVDFLFGNSGTDFPAIIEALTKAQTGGTKAPTPVTVPHENLAVAMAHRQRHLQRAERRAREHPSAVHRRAHAYP